MDELLNDVEFPPEDGAVAERGRQVRRALPRGVATSFAPAR